MEEDIKPATRPSSALRLFGILVMAAQFLTLVALVCAPRQLLLTGNDPYLIRLFSRPRGGSKAVRSTEGPNKAVLVLYFDTSRRVSNEVHYVRSKLIKVPAVREPWVVEWVETVARCVCEVHVCCEDGRGRGRSNHLLASVWLGRLRLAQESFG